MKKKDLSRKKFPLKREEKRSYRKYSYGLKRKVVYEMESGYLSLEEARLLKELYQKEVLLLWNLIQKKLLKIFTMTQSTSQSRDGDNKLAKVILLFWKKDSKFRFIA